MIYSTLLEVFTQKNLGKAGRKSADLCTEKFLEFQTRSVAKMAAKDESYNGNLGGLGLGQVDGDHDCDDDEEDQSSSFSVQDKLVQQSNAVLEEWNECLEHLGKLWNVAHRISQVMEDALAENMGAGSRNDTFRYKIHALGKMVNIVEEVLENISDLEENDIREEKTKKICNFHNRGFCKKGKKCNFEHPEENYDLLKDGEVKCKTKECKKRYLASVSGTNTKRIQKGG